MSIGSRGLLALLLAGQVGFAAACGKSDSGDAKQPAPAPKEGTEAHRGKGDGSGEHKAEARIYAAASLTDVIGALGKQFEPKSGSHLVPSYGASNTLAQQIHEGAAPGVFVSASVEWVEKLEGWGLVEAGTRVDLLGNSLVVIVPKDAKDRPATLQDLADAKYARLALADPVAVPAGKYAKTALERAGLFDGLKGKVVAAQDVRTALAYVERGEAPVGIVYATDAASSGKVDVAFRVPSDLHPKIVCPMVLVKGANRRAHELHAFLQTPEAWAVFEKAGFTKP
jgi:molybdate transport system substrate-binding protein